MSDSNKVLLPLLIEALHSSAQEIIVIPSKNSLLFRTRSYCHSVQEVTVIPSKARNLTLLEFLYCVQENVNLSRFWRIEI